MARPTPPSSTALPPQFRHQDRHVFAHCRQGVFRQRRAHGRQQQGAQFGQGPCQHDPARAEQVGDVRDRHAQHLPGGGPPPPAPPGRTWRPGPRTRCRAAHVRVRPGRRGWPGPIYRPPSSHARRIRTAGRRGASSCAPAPPPTRCHDTARPEDTARRRSRSRRGPARNRRHRGTRRIGARPGRPSWYRSLDRPAPGRGAAAACRAARHASRAAAPAPGALRSISPCCPTPMPRTWPNSTPTHRAACVCRAAGGSGRPPRWRRDRASGPLAARHPARRRSGGCSPVRSPAPISTPPSRSICSTPSGRPAWPLRRSPTRRTIPSPSSRTTMLETVEASRWVSMQRLRWELPGCCRSAWNTRAVLMRRMSAELMRGTEVDLTLP